MNSSSGAPKRVLFLCTGNSARSQIAEALLRHIAPMRFDAFSAGTAPAAQVHPGALEVLRRHNVPSAGLGPKHVSKFLGEPFTYVITLCDRAQEQCPTFEHAEMMHWTFVDPTKARDADARRRAFDDYFAGVSNRLRFLIIVDEKR
jgi:protein-tyrosine-phosphatase